jgi:hypothetical protein
MKKSLPLVARGKDFEQTPQGGERFETVICFSSSPEQEIKSRRTGLDITRPLIGTPAFIGEVAY